MTTVFFMVRIWQCLLGWYPKAVSVLFLGLIVWSLDYILTKIKLQALYNTPFLSSKNSYFQFKAKCTIFLVKYLCFICTKMQKSFSNQ